MTRETFKKYFTWLKKEIGPRTFAFILGIYPVHIQDFTKRYAMGWPLTSISLRAGPMDYCHLLDRGHSDV
jgi:hypothetical protein